MWATHFRHQILSLKTQNVKIFPVLICCGFEIISRVVNASSAENFNFGLIFDIRLTGTQIRRGVYDLITCELKVHVVVFLGGG